MKFLKSQQRRSEKSDNKVVEIIYKICKGIHMPLSLRRIKGVKHWGTKILGVWFFFQNPSVEGPI